MSKKYSQGEFRRPKKIFKKMGSLFLSLIVLVGLFFAGKGFANLLTSGNISWFGGNKINIKSVNYFAIYFGEFDSEEEALNCSIWTGGAGGSAYVYKQNKYMVMGQLYVNIDDAETVLNNFSDDITYEPSIAQFKTEKVVVKIDNLEYTDKKKIDSDINIIYDILENVLKISNNLDKSLISNVSASSEINSLKSEVKITKLDLMSINANYGNSGLTKLINFFVSMEDSLDVCTSKLLMNENYSNVCKYCACEIFFNYYDFVKNFDK